MSGGEGENEGTLEYTPTWVVAAVCTVIVGISLAVERLLHYTGKVYLHPFFSVCVCVYFKHLFTFLDFFFFVMFVLYVGFMFSWLLLIDQWKLCFIFADLVCPYWFV